MTASPGALVRGMRPRQWVKNLLVLAVPLAAGEITNPDDLVPTLLAFVAFCALSSAVYLMNDCVDRDADRLHPVKRNRPIASGELSVPVAWTAAVVLAVTGLVVSVLADVDLLWLCLGYLVLQIGYSLRFKHEPVLDLAVVTSGFLLRAVAGGVAADLRISQWFLLVAGFGSLFVVAGKRYSELHLLGTEGGTRRSLAGYTDTYLRFVWSVAAAATLMAYCLWAFEVRGDSVIAWSALSIAPFAMGVLRYAVDIDAGSASEPEDIVWDDRVLQVIGSAWLVLVVLEVSHG